MTNSVALVMVGMKTFQQISSALIGSYHNIPVESWQFAQNGFISIDRELFIGIGNNIHFSYDIHYILNGAWKYVNIGVWQTVRLIYNT